MTLAPELATLADAVGRVAERPAHLSGSGSTLFVLTDDALHAEFLARAITEQLAVPAAAVATHPGPIPGPPPSPPTPTPTPTPPAPGAAA